MNKIEAPVLLIAFNRPTTTRFVFEAIRRAQPKKIYIAVDAPRINNTEDEKNCTLVREIVREVDWDCETHYRFAEANQGCGPGPLNAISWAFENEDRLIVLEDDCVPAQPFFNYCYELLERYKNDTRIWTISGIQYYEEAVKTNHSYFFSRYGQSSGWATWKRCWSAMDFSLSEYPLIIEQDLYKAAFRTDKEATFFQNKLNRIYYDESLKSHIWDVQFGFAINSNGGLNIIPSKNLIKNIGYVGTHSNSKLWFHDRSVAENFRIISHPDFILCDVNYDVYLFEHQWNIKPSLHKRIIKKITRILKRLKLSEIQRKIIS